MDLLYHTRPPAAIVSSVYTVVNHLRPVEEKKCPRQYDTTLYNTKHLAYAENDDFWPALSIERIETRTEK